MRHTALAIVLALLLPTPLALGGHDGGTPPPPLAFFGGGSRATAAAPVLLFEVYYHALRSDEYVGLVNVAPVPVDLTDWTVTDGEGVLTFPAGASIAPGARIAVAQNATAYAEATLRSADFRYRTGDATPMGVRGTFQLNNAGDEVLLRDANGSVVDAFVYGSSAYSGECWSGPPAGTVGKGHVARRGFSRSWIDTDTSADWDRLRVWSLGQSEIPPATFAFEGDVTAIVSPDAGVEALVDLVTTANATIDVSAYTFTNPPLAGALRASLARGVRVRLLLEGGPVGGIPADGWALASDLAADGAQVHFLVDDTAAGIQERYRYAHAKYAILDGETLVLSSENWGASGFPTRGTAGSRGWTVAVAHAPLASYFASVFEGDFDPRRMDVRLLAAMAVAPGPPREAPAGARAAAFLPETVSGPFRVTAFVGPDATLAEGTVLGALAAAQRTIHAQLFYAHPAWGPFPNPYLGALVDAARRGVSVRLLLDASPYNAEDGDPNDNDDAVRALAAIAREEGLDLVAKLVRLDAHGLVRLHNKGFVVDGRTVLVSSVNWNRNSATANREAGALIENERLAAVFERAFASDWRDDTTAPFADAGPDRAAWVGETVTFSGLGSWDAGGIAAYAWDLDADGTFEARGPEVTHAFLLPGTHVVRLRVEDPWGNAAEDAVTVTVRASEEPSDLPVAAIGLVAVPVVGVSFALARRRRKGSNRPPKME